MVLKNLYTIYKKRCRFNNSRNFIRCNRQFKVITFYILTPMNVLSIIIIYKNALKCFNLNIYF